MEGSQVNYLGKDRVNFRKKHSTSLFNAKLENIKKLLKEFNSRIKNIETKIDEQSQQIINMANENKQDLIFQKIRDCNNEIEELKKVIVFFKNKGSTHFKKLFMGPLEDLKATK